MYIVFALAALAQASPQQAAPPSPIATATSQTNVGRAAAGLELAQLLFPLNRQTALLDRTMDRDMRSSLLKDEAIAEIEDENPGLVAAMIAAMRPVLLKNLEKQLPGYHRGIGAIYARHMDEAEIRDAMAFFGSPAGRKFVDQVNENMSFAPIMDNVVADPDAPIARDDIAKAKMDAAARTVANMDADQAAAIMTLAGRSWTKKLATIRAEITAYDQEQMNAPDPELDKELERVMSSTVERFLAE